MQPSGFNPLVGGSSVKKNNTDRSAPRRAPPLDLFYLCLQPRLGTGSDTEWMKNGDVRGLWQGGVWIRTSGENVGQMRDCVRVVWAQEPFWDGGWFRSAAGRAQSPRMTESQMKYAWGQSNKGGVRGNGFLATCCCVNGFFFRFVRDQGLWLDLELVLCRCRVEVTDTRVCVL